jgi:hypothetical protein
MRINLIFLQFEHWNDNAGFLYKDPTARKGFWIRIFGWGIHVCNHPKLFSERNGLEKFWNLPFGYRIKLLKRHK